jgi:hypothetical protein
MTQAFWGPGDAPVVRGVPADPWAGHTTESRVVADRRARRPIFGFVYELKTRGQAPGTSAYVGKCVGPTPKAVQERVHGSSASAHTSAQSVARDPWKADILPGRDGWRILERVYVTGDPEADEAALRRAEADWIDRKKTIHNGVRPVRPFGEQPRPVPRHRVAPQPARPRPVSAREQQRRAREAARRRRTAWRVVAVLLLAAVFTYLAARVVVNMHLPWPSVTWWLPPAIGVALAWVTFWRTSKAVKKLTR